MFETFSKRKKRATDVQEVYQTMELPAPLRVQIVHWWRDTIGEYKENAHGYYPYVPTINGWWEQIHAYIIREHGVFYLQTSNANPFED